MLLDGRGRGGVLFYVGRNHHGIELVQFQVLCFAPGGRTAGGLAASVAGVPVADVRGEEFQKAKKDLLANMSDQGRESI